MWNSECNHISQMVKKMGNWLFSNETERLITVFHCLIVGPVKMNSQESLLDGLNSSASSLQNRNVSYNFSWREEGLSSRKWQGLEQWFSRFCMSGTYSLEWMRRGKYQEKDRWKISLSQLKNFFSWLWNPFFRIFFRPNMKKRENRICFECGRVMGLSLWLPTTCLPIPGKS